MAHIDVASTGPSFVVEIGGKFNAAYDSLTTALRVGLELKNRDAQAQVKVYDRTERAPVSAE